MGRLLNRAIQHFGSNTSGMLEGGNFALLHTRTLEFDELRPYVRGDEIRDINWKASARSGETLVTKFVTEKHHKILLVCDAGRNMSALAPSGEYKRDVAGIVAGVIGLISMRRSDELGMVYGDQRGCVTVRSRKGENHIEGMLAQYDAHSRRGDAANSDIVTQLQFVAGSHRRRMLMVVVSEEPEVTPELEKIVKRLATSHELMWVAVSDMPAIGSEHGEHDSYDVATGRVLADWSALGPDVIAAYRSAEQKRVAELDEFFTKAGVPFARIGGSGQVRDRIVYLTEAYRNAGR
ncbi:MULTISPECIES: DUF58 domain-containing protein [Mycolicibacterium]|uniref:DUF58 domain-containing protein n=1 Tax=Mycolicibacterium TaxID=1866885 RepID=UPI00261B3D0F|nr:DUF58 domain-containing protein [Mycolicibacterium fortuitum]